MKRIVALDTETTGLSYAQGHKLVEIGCIEIIDNMETGNYFHAYVNPRRDLSYHAIKVHGLTREFLSSKPEFSVVAQSFLDFVNEGVLIAHNASFDFGFINNELALEGFKEINRARVIDTIAIARRKFPGASISLNALCKRFRIPINDRKFHGALLDARLLARVYLEMMTGAQNKMDFTPNLARETIKTESIFPNLRKKILPSEEELEMHKQMTAKMSKPLWGG